jgi:pimeloyl-ACP methyl ester carboxylesterase
MNSSERWVLLRGLTRESRHWGAFPQALQAGLGDAEVLTPDLPGCGVLHEQRSPARIEDMVANYRAELQARKIAPPYRLLALSLGAMVAVEWAQRHAGEVDAIVLINTSLRPINPFTQRLRPRSYIDLIRLLLVAADAEKRERIILDRTSQRYRNDAALVEAWAGFRRQCPVSSANALRQLLAAWRYRAPALPPRVPILILSAARDQLVDPRCSAQIARLWQVPIATHADAGHDLPLDAPEWVVGQVREWSMSVEFWRKLGA